jgi:hypothetical protein
MGERTRNFGRRFTPDIRDNHYPMRAVLRAEPLPISRYYPIGPQLPMDQGQTGTCVAHAWTGFLCASLLMTKHPPNVFETYRGIIAIDEYTDNDHEINAPIEDLQSGTSVRAGAQYLRGKGHLKSFLWTRSADEMAHWLLLGHGTIVLGTNWYWDMGNPTDKGVVNVTGGIAGGHSYLCVGYNRVTKMFRCLNSWGRNFGTNGRFWVRHDDMQRLIVEDGEACAAVEQVVLPVP